MNTLASLLSSASPAQPTLPQAVTSAGATIKALTGAQIPSRDEAVTNLSSIVGSVNALAQAAGSTSSADPSQQLTMPPLPPMPAPQAAPAVPNDDHGQSNIVFEDGTADGDLIH